MYPQPSSQSSVGAQPKPLICYNCGSGDHFMIACPEQARPIPAGLAAARAAQAAENAQPSGMAGNSHSGYVNRPSKRQKTGPVVTRFPAPPTGPVITHYAPQPIQSFPYTPNASQNFCAATPAEPYQQQAMLQTQPYIQSLPSQQSTPFLPHGPPSTTVLSQGYGQPILNLPNGIHSYSQPTLQSVPQYAYQNAYGAPYQDTFQAVQISQSYAYDSSPYYGQSLNNGPPSQSCPPLQPHPSLHGSAGQQYTAYQGPSPVQAYGPPTPAHDRSVMHNWSQPPTAPQPYHASAYQPGNTQHLQSQPSQYRKRSYQHGNQKQSQHGMPGNPVKIPNPYSGLSTLQKGNGAFGNQQNYRKYSESPRSNPVTDSIFGSTTLPPHSPSADKRNEESEFDWNLKMIFATEVKKKPDPIGHPLPTVFDEQPILPPVYNASGIISKYVRPNNLEIFQRDIRFSLHWPSVKPDPAFHEIDFNSPLIPLDDIAVWIQQRQAGFDFQDSTQDTDHLSPLHKRALSGGYENDARKIRQDLSYEPVFPRNNQFPPGAMDGTSETQRLLREIIPVMNRSITPICARSITPSLEPDDDAWAPQPGEGQIATPPVMDATEALLASLGVTGSPKPIVSNNTVPHVSPVYMDELSREFYNRAPVRHDSGYASQRGSISHESKNTTEGATPYSEYRQIYNASNPPPPPPPPLRMRKRGDGPLDSPSSDEPNQFRAGGGILLHEIQNNGPRQGSSPLTPNSAEGSTHENMVLNERKVSKRPAPIRQVDDVTPKLKRRQPQVADAYSRRW